MVVAPRQAVEQAAALFDDLAMEAGVINEEDSVEEFLTENCPNLTDPSPERDAAEEFKDLLEAFNVDDEDC